MNASRVRIVPVVLAGLAFCLLALSGCAPAQPSAPEMTLGEVNVAQIQTEPGWENLHAGDYTPDAALVEAIRAGAGDIEVLAFLGFWCPDSQREVPRWIKLMEAAGLKEDQVTYISLDTSKTDAEGLTERHGVEYVPTFIVLRGGQEIGRIVERPAETLEADLAAMLQVN